jgi:iron complex transport system substrate-binding protein
VRSLSTRCATTLVALALVAACGGDDAESTEAQPGPADASTTPSATEFPITLEHKYGETTIDTEPVRVVSVGYSEQDTLLALGVMPVAVRDWYGEQPFATWPWAQDELGDAEPTVLSSAELNFEEIASLEPDLIVGVYSGMTEADYLTLAAIAPTLAQPGDYIDYGVPWDVSVRMIGDATGRADEAESVIAEVEAQFERAREQHPEFAGATASVAFVFEEQPGAYASADPRSQLLAELGFVTPTEFDDLAGDQFFFSVSQERLATVDTDVVVWIAGDDTALASISAMPLRPTLRAFSEGREVAADVLLSGAFSFASPLSIQYLLDELVPELALAVDGDPATEVPSATELLGSAPTPAGSDPAQVWSTVFDSAAAFEDKAPHLADADALRATVEGYTQAGAAMGGISLVPTDVAVQGDTATVTYDVMFGDAAAYSDLTGTMSLIDGTWTVSREEFCGFMASARNPCPPG